MPALETIPRAIDARPALGHVNLMVDTLIANANIEDLRSICRGLLATNPPALAAAFTKTARSRLCQTSHRGIIKPQHLFTTTADFSSSPTPHLYDALGRARSLYGAGLGFASISGLTAIVRATIGLRWLEDSDVADVLNIIDADIGQAIQSSKEEMEAGRVTDFDHARTIITDLRRAVEDSSAAVSSWGGEFPFERAESSLEVWKF